MQRLEVSGVVRLIYKSLGVRGLKTGVHILVRRVKAEGRKSRAVCVCVCVCVYVCVRACAENQKVRLQYP